MNAKELILGRLNITLSNAVILSATTALGIPLDEGVDFINHPVVNAVYAQLDAARNHELVKSEAERAQGFKGIDSIIVQSTLENLMINLPEESPLRTLERYELKSLYKELLNFIANSITIQEGKKLSLDNGARLTQLQGNISLENVNKEFTKQVEFSTTNVVGVLKQITELARGKELNAADIHYVHSKLVAYLTKSEGLGDKEAKIKAAQILNIVSIAHSKEAEAINLAIALVDERQEDKSIKKILTVSNKKSFKDLADVDFRNSKHPKTYYKITLNQNLNIAAISIKGKGLKYATETYFKESGITNTSEQQLSGFSKLLKQPDGREKLKALVSRFFLNPDNVVYSLAVNMDTPYTQSGAFDTVEYSTNSKDDQYVPYAANLIQMYISYVKEGSDEVIDRSNIGEKEQQAAEEIAELMVSTDNRLLDQLFRFNKIGQSLGKLAKMLAINQGNPNRLDSLLSFVKSLEVYINNQYISTGNYADKDRFEFDRFFSNDRKYIDRQIKLFDATNNKVFNILLVLDKQKHYNTYLQSVINEWKMIEKMSFTSQAVKSFLDALTEIRQHSGRYYRYLSSLNNVNAETALDIDTVKEVQSFIEDRKVLYYIKNGLDKSEQKISLDFTEGTIEYDLTKFADRSKFLLDFSRYVPNIKKEYPRDNIFLEEISNMQIKDRLTNSTVILLEGVQFNQLDETKKLILKIDFGNLKLEHKKLFFLYDLIAKAGMNPIIDLKTKNHYNDFISSLVENSDKRNKFIRHLTNSDEKIMDLFLQVSQKTPALFSDITTTRESVSFTNEDGEYMGEETITTTTYKGLYDGDDNVNPRYFTFGKDFTTIVKNKQWSGYADVQDDVTETFYYALNRLSSSDKVDPREEHQIKQLFDRVYGIFEIYKYEPGAIARAILDTDSILTYDNWKEMVQKEKEIAQIPYLYRNSVTKIDTLLADTSKPYKIIEEVKTVEKTPVAITKLNGITEEYAKSQDNDANNIISKITDTTELTVDSGHTGTNLMLYVTKDANNKVITDIVTDVLVSVLKSPNLLNIKDVSNLLNNRLKAELVSNKEFYTRMYDNLYGVGKENVPKAIQVLLRLTESGDSTLYDTLLLRAKLKDKSIDGIKDAKSTIKKLAYLIGRVNTLTATSELSTKQFKGLNLIGQVLTKLLTAEKDQFKQLHKDLVSTKDLLQAMSKLDKFPNFSVDKAVAEEELTRSTNWVKDPIKTIKRTKRNALAPLTPDTLVKRFTQNKVIYNPFDIEFTKNTQLTPVQKNQQATIKFINWLLGNDDTDRFVEYRKVLVDTILSDLTNGTNVLVGNNIVHSIGTKYSHGKALSLMLNTHSDMFSRKVATMGLDDSKIDTIFDELFTNNLIKYC